MTKIGNIPNPKMVKDSMDLGDGRFEELIKY
jgi:hypothetical protein